MGIKQTRGHRVGPLDIEILRTAILLSAHESRHVDGGLDEIDSVLDPRAIALTAHGDVVFRGAAVLQRLAPVDRRFLQSQGVGADLLWVAVPPVNTETLFLDDFLGEALMIPPWNRAVVNTGWAVLHTTEIGGVLDCFTGGGINSSVTISFATRLPFRTTRDVELQVRSLVTDPTQITVFIGLTDLTGLQDIGFYYSAAAAANWFARTLSGGASTITDTGILADTAYHIFRIMTSPTQVEFFIDGSSVAIHTTNIPATGLCPELYIWNAVAADRRLYTDYFLVKQTRD